MFIVVFPWPVLAQEEYSHLLQARFDQFLLAIDFVDLLTPVLEVHLQLY